MQASSYRKIVLLLSFSLLSIVFVQAFWLRSFYVEKKEQFRSAVYQALEQIGSRLHEQDQLRVIKERGDSLLTARRQIIKVMSGKRKAVNSKRKIKTNGTSVFIGNNNNTVLVATSPSKMAFATAPGAIAIDSMESEIHVVQGNSDENMMVVQKQMQEVSVSLQKMEADFQKMGGDYQKREAGYHMRKARAMAGAPVVRQAWVDSVREAEIEDLLGRMITEIHVLDERNGNPDSLSRLIGTTLKSKGITTPYEFSLRKMIGTKEQALVQSRGYDSTRVTFVGDLSANKLFETNRFLFLQFPDQQSALLGSIKGSLLLSLLFTGIILSVFFYTVRLLLRQKKISEIRNDFVNNMTHELKTPIATISLAVDAMQHPQVRGSEERYNEYTRILKEENAKLNSHVERVLQLALFDKGQLEINRKPMDVSEVTGAQVRTYRLQAEAKGLQLFYTRSGTAFDVNADKEHLGSAISNLIDNAIKYTDKNGVVNVNVDSADGVVTVSVSDTGCGIARDELDKVFDRFYRINNSTVHDVKGFGIGLSYVKSIVEAHGGSISLDSAPGKGSTFRITLKGDD